MRLTWTPFLEHDPAIGDAAGLGRLVAERILGAPTRADVAFDRIEAGLPVGALARLIGDFGKDPVLNAIGVSQRTYERRRSDGRLTPEESDRVYRMARVYALAADVLGGADEAREWLLAPAVSLGDRTPLAATRNDAGARSVEDVLHRIEHGVYG